MTDEDYWEIKADLLEHPDWPFFFAKLDMAKDFHSRIVKEYPTATLLPLLAGYTVCLDTRAVLKQEDLLREWRAKKRKKNEAL